jgi:Arc/MetJ-type ribon-helix-helix transcriptional regulator
LTYAAHVSTQIAIRLDDDDLAALDAEVQEGRAASRSDALRRGIAHLRREQRYRAEEAVLAELVRRGESVYPDLEGVLDLARPPLD